MHSSQILHLELRDVLRLSLHLAKAVGFDDFFELRNHLLLGHARRQLDHRAVKNREFKIVCGIHHNVCLSRKRFHIAQIRASDSWPP